MKKKFLCFALAAMLLCGSVVTTTPVYAAGGDTTVTLTKKEADTEAPTGTITIETNYWNTFLNTITFNTLFKMTKNVTIKAEDNVAVASVQYYASAEALTLEQVKALDADTWNTYPENGFTLAPTSSYVVYALITDTSGNKTYISSDGLVFLTEKAPDIFVTDISQSSFTVQANVDKGAVAGIKEVGIRYRRSGDDTWTEVKASSVRASNALTVTGLVAGASYKVCAFVTYIDGKTSETIEENATTITTEKENLPAGSITVAIDSKLSDSRDAVITIESGNDAIAAATAKEINNSKPASTAFENLPDGVYNVVVRTTDSKFVETKIITIKDGSAGNVTFTILEGERKSIVEVVDNVAPVAVEGLSEILSDTKVVSADEIERVKEGKLSVTIKLQVKNEDSSSEVASQIKSLADKENYTVSKLLDLSLYKVTKALTGDSASETEVNIGSRNTNVLEIAVPYETTIENLSVFRYHGNTATELTKRSTQPSEDYTDGTFYVGDGYIYIYASGFSVYGITEPKAKADGPDAPGGLVPKAPTTRGGSDGQISGVTTDMEYSTDGGSTWTQVTDNTITGLKAGTVLVRVAETDTTYPGKSATVVVPKYRAHSTDKTSDSATGTVATSPRTGDDSHLVLWGSLIVCSAAALGVVVVTGRRKKQN